VRRNIWNVQINRSDVSKKKKAVENKYKENELKGGKIPNRSKVRVRRNSLNVRRFIEKCVCVCVCVCL